MSDVKSLGARLSSGSLSSFIPEPRSGVSGFAKVMNAVGAVASKASSVVGINPEYQALIEKQMEVQAQMQLVTMSSNIEKSKHETQMSAIRNVRAG